ncbi:MAG: crossover junction endodeoxyribonuclease RuvC [Acidimicrobiia bacterium]
MFVLGIDPGLTRTGYAVVEASGATEHLVVAGVIRTNANEPVAGRLLELRRDVEGLLDDHEVDTAAIEQVFVNRNRNTAMAVARASGVIMATLAFRDIAVAEYTPSQMKMAVTGSGAADKNQISAVVAMRLGIPKLDGPADVADAVGIALCHTQHSGVLTGRSRR